MTPIDNEINWSRKVGKSLFTKISFNVANKTLLPTRSMDTLIVRKIAPESHAEKSEAGAKNTIATIDDIVKSLPEKTRLATQLSKDVDNANKNRDLTNDQREYRGGFRKGH